MEVTNQLEGDDAGSGRLALFSEAFILSQDVEVDFVAHRNASSNVKKIRRDPILKSLSEFRFDL
jgi:hypothetical protein